MSTYLNNCGYLLRDTSAVAHSFRFTSYDARSPVLSCTPRAPAARSSSRSPRLSRNVRRPTSRPADRTCGARTTSCASRRADSSASAPSASECFQHLCVHRPPPDAISASTLRNVFSSRLTHSVCLFVFRIALRPAVTLNTSILFGTRPPPASRTPDLSEQY